MAIVRKTLHLEKYLQPIHFHNLGKLMLAMSLLWGYFVFNERLVTWYGNTPHEMAALWSTQMGRYSPLFWTMIACNFVLPFPLLVIKKLRSITATVIASCGVVIGMWLERFLIIVPSLSYKGTPYSWGAYLPRWPEIVIFSSSFAAMALLYLLFSKFIPIISIWEMKVGEHPHIKVAAEVQEAEAAGELA
jgi:molybdopterin-containing oxidoreductase family membrane subunit